MKNFIRNIKKCFLILPLIMCISLIKISAEEYVSYLTLGNFGSGNGQFIYPTGITIDSSGNIYVVDTGNNRIQKFDSSRNFILKWGNFGDGNGQFSSPVGIAVDSSGNVYIADSGNRRIQKFDSSGNFILKWSGFSYPRWIAIDSFDNVYIVDYYHHCIRKFDSSGNFILEWGSNGNSNGQFINPTGITIDSFGNIYVIDTRNSRIQKFDSSGNFILKWGSYGYDTGQFIYGDGQHVQLGGIAVDSFDNIYIADDKHIIQKFDSSGNFILKWGDKDGQLNRPIGIIIDSTHNIYVADSNNYRIQIFKSLSDISKIEDEKFVIGNNLIQKGESSRIYFHLNQRSKVRIDAYDIAGDIADEILDEYRDAGDHVKYWPSVEEELVPGLYIISIVTDEYSKCKKIAVTR